MNIKLILSALVVVAFTTLGVTDAVNQKHQLQIKDVQLHSKTEEIQKLQVKHQSLDSQLKNELQQKQVNEEKVKQLETEKQQADEKIRQLEARKAEKSRLASLVGTSKVSAAAMPQTAPNVGGSGCAWLSGVLQQHGITGANLNAAINIASRESGCRQNAVNAGGGACNVFQELPCGKWGGSGNLSAHINGATNYANSRYGGWQGAWAAWQAKHWW